jgi:outer membrane protein insertion porin family
MIYRRRSLVAALNCFLLALVITGPLEGQSAAQQTPPADPPKPPAAKPASPFESVPQTTEQAKPKPPGPFESVPATPEAAKPAEEEAPLSPDEVPDVVEAIEFRGARRVPQDTLRALIFTKAGDRYDPQALNRDFMALWNTGRFDDIVLEREPGRKGWIVRYLVTERRVIRKIEYPGAKSVTVSEILDRFKERRVGLSVEQQYEQARVQRAAVVLKEFLAERGRQFATVTPEVRQIPPSSVEVNLRVDEGAKVKVGKIEILGNKAFGDRAVIRAMANSRPIGIPKSIFLESLFAKTFDSSKLEEDKDRIRMFYSQRGYFLARATEHKVTMRDTPGGRIWWFPPMIWKKTKPGKKADITVTMEEGRLYRLGKINFTGVKQFKTLDVFAPGLFKMNTGDVFSTEKLGKGLQELTKLYGNFGFIDAVADPDFDPRPDGTLDLTLNIDEGERFFVRRIDFEGNTTTRDKVIRRELLLDEGDVYNTRLWELSILRLNQLGYFEALKEEEAAQITRDTRNNTIDITLKLKERGRNSVSLNGGVSGIAGSFIGFGYATNNFLGLGETLSLDAQLGDRVRNVTFGFTEPYFLDRPMQLGFTVYTQRFNFDQAREVSLFSGRNLIPLYESLGRENLLNYVTNGVGATVFWSYPLRRSFARLSLTYGLDRQNVRTLNDATNDQFQFSNFLNFDGPNQLSGIVTSRVVPSYQYNTIDHPITPSRGKSIFASVSVAGGPLGGNVNTIEPTLSFTYFRPAFRRGHVFGMRVLGRLIAGYGGRTAPPFNRVFMGGENDVRGFEIWSILPAVFIPSEGITEVLNDDGSARLQPVIIDGVRQNVIATQRIPVYQFIPTGGDTQGVANFEYRIPIVGPVVLAAFFDAGTNRISLPNQLRLNPGRVAELNVNHPGAQFENQSQVIRATQQIRTSTGLELQIMMPVVNAPFRLYWAYNPTIVQDFFQPPIAADPSLFPNQATLIRAAQQFALPRPWFERRSMFRFTISRTF